MADAKIKSLKWEGDEYVGWAAYALGLSYLIDDESDDADDCFVLSTGEGVSVLKSAHKTLIDAKEFAQSDFERHVFKTCSKGEETDETHCADAL